MKNDRRLKSPVISAIGVLVCAWSAALICILMRGRTPGALIPIAFLAVVTFVAMRCGMVAGILGSAIAALIFSIFLYRPIGTPVVVDPGARANLAWIVMGGLACSYLVGTGYTGPQQHH